jgi:hypothetical protein
MQVILTTDERRYLNWANQFVERDPSGRARVIFPRSGSSPAEALRLIEQAAGQAGQSGRVIISVGHGAVTETGDAAWVDLAPDGAFRLDQALITDLARRESDATLIRNVAEMAGSTPPSDFCNQLLGGSRPALPLGLEPEIAEARCSSFPAATARTDLRRVYTQIGETLRRNRVIEVLFLACRIGTASDFMSRLAADWAVSILAYLERIVADEEGENHRTRLFRQGLAPPPGTVASHQSERELPTGYITVTPP